MNLWIADIAPGTTGEETESDARPLATVASAIGCFAAMLMFGANAVAGEFATKDGPQPANIDEIATVLRQDSYDMELLISYGTSKGGSAGHLALAIRDPASSDDLVYTANFYADRARKHEKGFYTADLMVRVPKTEYLFKTNSSLGDTASFGLDFGEIYKRTVIGIRVYGVPAAEKAAVAAFFHRINDDYHNRTRNTQYHQGEVRYDYLRLNCAKTIGAGFKYGAGYGDLDVTSAKLFSGRRVYNLSKYRVRVNDETKLLEIDKSKEPMPYAEAAKVAAKTAGSDGESFRRRLKFQPEGTEIGHTANERTTTGIAQ